ncbi:hypothetical protein QM996_24920 (plasmid) [Sinorhizobium chiapasense]|uniref:hypothetical protein n=1 Tax=Sinorhizobium chiapasense TaxID=501572 RepID=UPI002FE0EB62
MQAVVYTSDTKREWFGATEGRDKPSWLSGSTPRDIGHAPFERFASKPVDAYSPDLNYSRRMSTSAANIIPLLIREVSRGDGMPPPDTAAILGEADRVASDE